MVRHASQEDSGSNLSVTILLVCQICILLLVIIRIPLTQRIPIRLLIFHRGGLDIQPIAAPEPSVRSGLGRRGHQDHSCGEPLAPNPSRLLGSIGELLADAPVRCPPFESYVERLVEYVRDRLREKRELRESNEVEVDDPLG
jgi:hypothetical protein